MSAFDYLYIIALMALALGLLFALLRAIRGPRIADRIMGINMIGSMVSVTLAILSVWLRQSWLLDVCILYAMISFLPSDSSSARSSSASAWRASSLPSWACSSSASS